MESIPPTGYREYLSIFIRELSPIKCIGLLILIVWNIAIIYGLVSYASILIGGTYITGQIEYVVATDNYCRKGVNQTCTSYSTIIGYDDPSSGMHHTFQSTAIGNRPIGEYYTVVSAGSDSNNPEVYTLVGVVMVIALLCWLMFTMTPIYLMIWKNIEKRIPHSTSTTTKERYTFGFLMQLWCYSLLISMLLGGSIFLYFDGGRLIPMIAIILIFVVLYQAKKHQDS